MDGRWIKVIIFVLLVIMISSVVSALLDPGLGKPDNARRTRHAGGFSICYPVGWGGTPMGSGAEGDDNYIRLAPERKTGRETSIKVTFTGLRTTTVKDGNEGTFQNQPAYFSSTRGKYDWQWRVQFQRDGKWYQIFLTSPLELDVQKSPFWPFIESFQIEKTINPAELTSSSTLAPASQPASAPAN